MLTKIVYVRSVLGKSEQISSIFYEILNFNVVILTIFLKEIWPLFGLFETPYGQIWPFNLFGPVNPDRPVHRSGDIRERQNERERER
jgi:hypothetical protein